MKTIFIGCLICLSIPLLNAQESDIEIKGSFQNEPLPLVLLDLEINYKLNFEYDEQLIENIRITAFFGKSSLDFGMSKILENTNFDFDIKTGRTIALFPKTDTPKVDWSNVAPTRKDFKASGVVKDGKTGETLPFANVTLQGTTNGVTTNIDGYFTFFNMPSDTAILLVSYLGYQTVSYRITPETDINNIEISLEDFGVQLEEIIVKATKEEQMLSASTGISRIGLSPAALAKLPSYGEKDIF